MLAAVRRAAKGRYAPSAEQNPLADLAAAPRRGSGVTKADIEPDSVPDTKPLYDRGAKEAWQAHLRALRHT